MDRSIPPFISSDQSRGWLGQSLQGRRLEVTCTATVVNGPRSSRAADHLQRPWGPHSLSILHKRVETAVSVLLLHQLQCATRPIL